MWAVCKKEFRQFFSSLTGYIAIVVFLLVTGLLLFVFPDTSILDFGYASLEKFFDLAPWVLLLLIPAISMRSFSEEFRSGTFEILQSKPLTQWQIVNGKYLAALLVIGIALIPTWIYYFSVQQLAAGTGMDTGAAFGAYIGLFLLTAVFAAIALCCSSFTTNSIIAFIASGFSCFLIYTGFHAISRISSLPAGFDYYIDMLGIDFHYRNMSRGLITMRDAVYFISVILFFLILTKNNLNKR
ncbi:MAG TPA: ABC transporter permease subunit [Puia sp.]|jgi:ABC-2 type transport system permease protein